MTENQADSLDCLFKVMKFINTYDCRIIWHFLCHNGVFTLADILRQNHKPIKKWLVKHCVEVFVLPRDEDR